MSVWWAPGKSVLNHNPLMGVGLSTHTDLAKAHTKRRSKATIFLSDCTQAAEEEGCVK